MQVDFQIIPGQFLFGNGWKNADAEMRLSVNSCVGSGGYTAFLTTVLLQL